MCLHLLVVASITDEYIIMQAVRSLKKACIMRILHYDNAFWLEKQVCSGKKACICRMTSCIMMYSSVQLAGTQLQAQALELSGQCHIQGGH
jgi:hypothetical protein